MRRRLCLFVCAAVAATAWTVGVAQPEPENADAHTVTHYNRFRITDTATGALIRIAKSECDIPIGAKSCSPVSGRVHNCGDITPPKDKPVAGETCTYVGHDGFHGARCDVSSLPQPGDPDYTSEVAAEGLEWAEHYELREVVSQGIKEYHAFHNCRTRCDRAVQDYGWHWNGTAACHDHGSASSSGGCD